ncbi:MAG TPA: hypothetical protein VJY35_07445, partial [Candidatus Eisenbacteria bacterium]|nr:hypothetical protein [Candidatus Eisenbacteria bacterium]
ATLMGLAGLALFMAAGWAIDGAFHGVLATALKLLLIPAAVVVAFATGLVTRYDLEKVSSVPLNVTWMRRTRDSAVAAGDRLARAVALRRSP